MSTSDFFDNWTTQVRKGLLELCVLSAIAGRRRYGYEIVKRLGDVPGLVISEGTIYPILSRLRREELVETTLEDSVEGPARKYYQLTAKGRRQLAQMRTYWSEIVSAIETLEEDRR